MGVENPIWVKKKGNNSEYIMKQLLSSASLRPFIALAQGPKDIEYECYISQDIN